MGIPPTEDGLSDLVVDCQIFLDSPLQTHTQTQACGGGGGGGGSGAGSLSVSKKTEKTMSWTCCCPGSLGQVVGVYHGPPIERICKLNDCALLGGHKWKVQFAKDVPLVALCIRYAYIAYLI